VARCPRGRGADEADRTALRVSLDAALARLTRRQRLVLVLRFYEDMTERQVADALGCSAGTIKRHAHDGLARLGEHAQHLVRDGWAPVKEAKL
jgi:RNA polymerase sigma factor (sigma-70 family)